MRPNLNTRDGLIEWIDILDRHLYRAHRHRGLLTIALVVVAGVALLGWVR